MFLKQQAEPKFSTRRYNRCKICGRPHAYLRKYGICRICFRNLAYKGEIPGVKKSSWKFEVKEFQHTLSDGAMPRTEPPPIGRKTGRIWQARPVARSTPARQCRSPARKLEARPVCS